MNWWMNRKRFCCTYPMIANDNRAVQFGPIVLAFDETKRVPDVPSSELILYIQKQLISGRAEAVRYLQ